VGTYGKDNANNCKLSTLPCQTINNAISQAAQSGYNVTLIEVFDGTYYIKAAISIQNFTQKSITISSSNGNAQNITIDGQESTVCFNISDSTNVSIISFTMTNCLGAIKSSLSTIKLDSLDIVGNSAPSGSAITLVDSVMTLNNSLIEENIVKGSGTIFMTSRSKAIIDNTIISYNRAQSGGAIYVEGNTSLKMQNVLIRRNDASRSGGGIYCASPSTSFNDFVDCDINLNTAPEIGNVDCQGCMNCVSCDNCVNGNCEKLGCACFNDTTNGHWNGTGCSQCSNEWQGVRCNEPFSEKNGREPFPMWAIFLVVFGGMGACVAAGLVYYLKARKRFENQYQALQ